SDDTMVRTSPGKSPELVSPTTIAAPNGSTATACAKSFPKLPPRNVEETSPSPADVRRVTNASQEPGKPLKLPWNAPTLVGNDADCVEPTMMAAPDGSSARPSAWSPLLPPTKVE